MNRFWGKEKMKELLGQARKWLPSRSKEATPAKEQVESVAVTYKKAWNQTYTAFMQHKWSIAKTVAVLGMSTALTWGGHQYVQSSMIEYYNVYANGQHIGTVSDPSVVKLYSDSKKLELAQGPSNVTMIVKEPQVEFMAERAFNAKPEDEEMLARLDTYFSSYPVGYELVVDGKKVGIVKDQETAELVLEQIKDNVLSAMGTKKEPGKVSILSAANRAKQEEKSELQSVDFVQSVELEQVKVNPEEVLEPEEMLKKLETGDVQPIKYTVEEGDSVSLIAYNFDIPKQVVYQNNPWIQNDMIKVGEEIDLTVLQPTLAVRTVEKVIENQEIQYETEYITDDNLRLGVVQVISPGKNGMKKVAVQLTKVNGLLEDETVLSEDIIVEPVKALAKKGTKVIKGEGTGKFAWPVLSSRITSTFGMRWGSLHKGIDMTGNKNILAADNGKVIFAGVKEGYGNAIIIDHLNGYKTLYGHMSKLLTSSGKIVEKGEKIGIMGSTGNSTGVHLHFEIHRKDKPENPLKYINR